MLSVMLDGGKLFDRFAQGELALGIDVMEPSPDLVMFFGQMGFDFCELSMHGSTIDWGVLANLVRAARLTRMTTVAKIPMYPWVGDHDPSLAKDVHRAINLGVSVVLVSVHGKRDVEECVEVTFDTHRPYVYNLKDRRRDEPEVVREEISNNTMVVPCLECDQALSEIDEILAVPNLKMIQLDLLDLSKLWGFLLDYDSTEMWDKLEPILDRCKRRNIKLLTNLGTTEYAPDWPRVWAKRIKRFYEGGFQAITAGSPTKMLRLSTQCLSEELRNIGTSVGIGDATTIRKKPRAS